MLSKYHLHIPEFIQKLYVFTFFSGGVISLTSYPFSARVIERKKNLNFVYMYCRYLNIVKTQRILLQEIENSQIATPLK
jgi:hypothetical protein